MTTPNRLLALTALLVVATGCSTEPESAADRAPSAPTIRAFAAATDAGRASTADIFECLVQGELYVLGPYERDVADGLAVETLQLGTTDRADADNNSGSLYLFADAGTATTYAETVRTVAIEEDDADPASVAAVHGTTVLVVDRALVPTAQERALLGCLPDADPATVVTAPAAGTASMGSLMACAAAAGLHSQGEHTYVDEMEDRIGRVKFQTDSGFGFYNDDATVRVYADAATAEAKEAEVTDGDEPDRFTRRGNTVAEFWGPIDAADPTTASVLACLPA